MLKQINRYRLLIFQFKKRDIIMLNNKNIKINRSNKFLNYKNLGFYKIIKVIDNIIYKLKLSKKINIFFVFHL